MRKILIVTFPNGVAVTNEVIQAKYLPQCWARTAHPAPANEMRNRGT